MLRALLCLGVSAFAQTPLRVAGNTTTIELSPVLLATRNGPINVINGGIPNIMSGAVDVATNAETQLLRQSIDNPDLRVVMTVAESFYRIIGKRSAGITKVADLKGKRIATPRNTSAHYFLFKMLATARLEEKNVQLITVPATEMAAALLDGRVDAIAMWEPEPEKAISSLGNDAIVLQDKRVYRELFNLNTSAKVLADPVKRLAVVELVRSIVASSESLRTSPRVFWPYISSKLTYTTELISRSWPDLRFAGGMVPDLLDVMEEEENWVAKERNRVPRSRAVGSAHRRLGIEGCTGATLAARGLIYPQLRHSHSFESLAGHATDAPVG